MKITNKNIELSFIDNDLLTLYTFEDFRKWYLNNFDLSMFLLEDINALLDEEKPDGYPCSPLINNCLDSVLYLNLKELSTIQKQP